MLSRSRSLTLVALVALAAGTAFAAFPGGNGKVAFESNRNGTFDLFTVEPDGTGTTLLVGLAGMERAAAWSPDGRKVAFQTNFNGNFDLWIVNADGTGLRALTSDPASEIQPSWSPDGSRIAFARVDAAVGSYDIWTIDAADGSGAVNVTADPGNDIRPSWSPDGGTILFQSDRDGDTEIYAIGVGAPPSSAVNLTRSLSEDTDPDVSPDGMRIVFVSDRDVFATRLWTMNRDGSGAAVIPGSEPGDRDPAFSPDGTAVTFTRTGFDGIEGVWRMGLDGSGLERIASGGFFTRVPDWQPLPATSENRPPSAHAGADGEIPCAGPDGASVRLDGSGSSDPDSTIGTNDDLAVFEWFVGFGTADERLLGTGAVLDVVLPPGTHEVTLRVTDRGGLSDTDTATWSVFDPDPPSISVEVSPSILWPANHRLVAVRANVVVAGGLCSRGGTAVLVAVTSSEPDDAPGAGDGHTRGDIAGADFGTPDFEVFLRAERMGGGPGRVYTLRYAIAEGAGAGTEASATVLVPHDHANRVADGGEPESRETAISRPVAPPPRPVRRN